MSWEIKIAKRARKQMERFPKKDAERLLFILGEISEDPTGEILKRWEQLTGAKILRS